MIAVRAIHLEIVVALVAVLITLTGQTPAIAVASALAASLLIGAFHHGRRAVVLAGAMKAATCAVSVREVTRRTAFLPQRDPDADGKPRPRAPGTNPAIV